MIPKGSTDPAKEIPEVEIQWAVSDGLTPYPDALAAMEARVVGIRAGTASEAVWLVEHPPTYTAGTSARPEELIERRFPHFAAGRGGQWTYHGPGQRTAYVMLDLHKPHGPVPARDIRAYVHGLEEWMIRALDRFNVRGERRQGRVGIWVVKSGGAEFKIGAIGVRVTRWVSWHGIALNVEPDLSHFGGIVPCGIAEHGVTSLHDLGILATMEEADAALMSAWGEVFGGHELAAETTLPI
ncbi:lipoyl(octanoyl) transferase LipB [Roseococcus sp. SYP-B2431]|uniref:lipoyl(octanoyl) transferase LipB n=1 Tax=Roseococcus sp. SYP-B2431 TaxID=2496640 RepID=UPI00103BF7AD|nr:lipoyl(octanoyl) transferase LipB [Roseococcus sp. SYP-B2431]TCH98540.1 lipoyl(octanoyl) transferase LipB [Roseococcus sp. SYP-B2431]